MDLSLVHYLWRAVKQDSEVVDVYLQSRQGGAAAKRFFKRLLMAHGREPRKIVIDNLRSIVINRVYQFRVVKLAIPTGGL